MSAEISETMKALLDAHNRDIQEGRMKVFSYEPLPERTFPKALFGGGTPSPWGGSGGGKGGGGGDYTPPATVNISLGNSEYIVPKDWLENHAGIKPGPQTKGYEHQVVYFDEAHHLPDLHVEVKCGPAIDPSEAFKDAMRRAFEQQEARIHRPDHQNCRCVVHEVKAVPADPVAAQKAMKARYQALQRQVKVAPVEEDRRVAAPAHTGFLKQRPTDLRHGAAAWMAQED